MKKLLVILVFSTLSSFGQGSDFLVVKNFDTVKYYVGDSLYLKVVNDTVSSFLLEATGENDTILACYGVQFNNLDYPDFKFLTGKRSGKHFRVEYKDVPGRDYKNNSETYLVWERKFRIKRKVGLLTLTIPMSGFDKGSKCPVTIITQVDCKRIEFIKN